MADENHEEENHEEESHDESVSMWLERLKAGESEAAGKIWQRYVEQLLRLARRKLGGMPRRAADEEDVVLSAFHQFFDGVKQDRFPDLNDRDDLWQILVMLTERRAITRVRKETAAKRGGGTVRGDSVFLLRPGDDSEGLGLDQALAREASEPFVEELTMGLRELLEQLGDDKQREIALGKLQGYTNDELVQRLGLSLRTVERKLGIIRDKWKGELGRA